MFCLKLLLILNFTNAVLSKATFRSIFVQYFRMVSCVLKKSIGWALWVFKNLKPRRKPKTVTRQLAKSRDFRKNYLCDVHLYSLPSLTTLVLNQDSKNSLDNLSFEELKFFLWRIVCWNSFVYFLTRFLQFFEYKKSCSRFVPYLEFSLKHSRNAGIRSLTKSDLVTSEILQIVQSRGHPSKTKV